MELSGLIAVVQAEIAVAAAECDADATSPQEHADPLFRLRIARWGIAKDGLAGMLCVRDPRLWVLTFDFDVTELMALRQADDLATPPACRRTHMAVFARSAGADGGRRDPLVIDAAAARILDLSDGTRSAAQINAEVNEESHLSDDRAGLDRIEKLFSHGLILLVEEERRNAVHPPFVEVGVAGQ
jgi:hypothetical protein